MIHIEKHFGSIKIMLFGISIMMFGGIQVLDPARRADMAGAAAIIFGLIVVITGFFTKD